MRSKAIILQNKFNFPCFRLSQNSHNLEKLEKRPTTNPPNKGKEMNGKGLFARKVIVAMEYSTTWQW